ncbi:MAG TPA: ATP-dependent Clp protease adaptor ClpS [bacterium]|jgi:ATP-dependent Clp protease adaptor protein ClpS|nr:ATP-dependent Clp protease adaptor ClpS [bacterium]
MGSKSNVGMRVVLFGWLCRERWHPVGENWLSYAHTPAGSRRSQKPGALDSCVVKPYFADMAAVATPAVHPGIQTEELTGSSTELETGYLVICWNDPINLMDYVTHVFQVVFGWERRKAERHMLEVHKLGKSVLARESLEKAEFYVHQLQKYQLHATMERE